MNVAIFFQIYSLYTELHLQIERGEIVQPISYMFDGSLNSQLKDIISLIYIFHGKRPTETSANGSHLSQYQPSQIHTSQGHPLRQIQITPDQYGNRRKGILKMEKNTQATPSRPNRPAASEKIVI